MLIEIFIFVLFLPLSFGQELPSAKFLDDFARKHDKLSITLYLPDYFIGNSILKSHWDSFYA